MIVLDAAALVDVVAGHPSAGWVLDAMGAAPLSAPGHQLAEVVSALTRLHRAGDLGVDLEVAVDDAAALPQEVHLIDGWSMRRAVELGGRIRIVDGLYVALADRLGAALLTTDRRLAQADPPCEVIAPDGA